MPELADVAIVDVIEPLFCGDKPRPGPVTGSDHLRRAAFSSVPGNELRSACPLGDIDCIPPITPYGQTLIDLRPRLVRHLDHDSQWLASDPIRARLIRETGAHSLIAIPLTVAGAVLGLFVLFRRAGSEPFEECHLHDAIRLARQAALNLDIARRQIKEHARARLMSAPLLKEEPPSVSALEASHGHIPAGSGAGWWFDVIPLSSARVGLVVGRADGIGVQGAVGVGLSRTVITTLAALDLPPDELLARLDDVAIRPFRQHPHPLRGDGPSCLYVVYDPIAGRCVSARAGNPGLMIGRPDGSVSVPRFVARSPIGGDEQRFETAEFELPSGSTLALCGGSTTAPLPTPEGLTERLREALPASSPDLPRVIAHALGDLPPNRQPALLLTRVRAMEADRVATLTLPPEPAAVSAARAWAGRQLAAWMLEDFADSTALVISELVTNAIRYSGGPVGMRMIRDEHALICEVSDTSSSGPHRRCPAETDEGGRGLSIVTELTQRQGTHYTVSGKTVWTEQSLGAQGREAGAP
ncbi:SpoIIE family protein phosphatase [Streptomyces sp. NPDC055092]